MKHIGLSAAEIKVVSEGPYGHGVGQRFERAYKQRWGGVLPFEPYFVSDKLDFAVILELVQKGHPVVVISLWEPNAENLSALHDPQLQGVPDDRHLRHVDGQNYQTIAIPGIYLSGNDQKVDARLREFGLPGFSPDSPSPKYLTVLDGCILSQRFLEHEIDSLSAVPV